jgi:hypothetical protein
VSDSTLDHPIPAADQAVLTLFAGPLSAVSFPGVDRAVLEGAAERVARASEELHRVEILLAEARAALDQGREALAQTCARALAYARVYADGDDELSRHLDTMPPPRGPRRSPRVEETLPPTVAATTSTLPRKRGRPRRPGSEVLFHDDMVQTPERPEPEPEGSGVAA